jgi:circadian clock protein KaiB
MAKVRHLKAVPRARRLPPKHESFLLRLFTTGTSPRSMRALRNLHEICEGNLKGHYRLEVIDIYQEPGRASESDIIAAPTLIKDQPLPARRLIGDLSDRPKVLLTLAIASESK